MPDTSIRATFDAADMERKQSLDRARLCAALSIASVLPPIAMPEGQALPESWQSDGSYGITIMVGKMLLALFPPNQPWYELTLPPQTLYNPNVADTVKRAAMQRLFLWEMIIGAALESTALNATKGVRRVGFRSRKLAAIKQLLVTGDVLEEMDDDFGLKVFRRDQYVTKRDSSGNVMFHAIKEQVDPLALTPEQFMRSGLDKDKIDRQGAHERLVDYYSLVEWQPQTKKWTIRREVNGSDIDPVREEVYTPFFSTPFALTGGESYGRGFIETNLGDLRSLNELELRRLNILGLAGKQLMGIDRNSQVREKDLEKEPGKFVHGVQVRDGVVQDVGPIRFTDLKDFQMLSDGIRDKSGKLRTAMLIESTVTPRGERVTATQVQRVAMELEGALGGSYVPIADDQQVPLIHRAIHVLKKKAWLPPMPDRFVDIATLTGLAAVAREMQAGKLLNFAAAVAQLGPEAVTWIGMRPLLEAYQRLTGVWQPGLVKSEAEVNAQQEKVIQQQVTLAAGEQAVQTAGALVEQAAAQGAP